MLKCYDSVTDGSVSRWSFHTACGVPPAPADARTSSSGPLSSSRRAGRGRARRIRSGSANREIGRCATRALHWGGGRASRIRPRAQGFYGQTRRFPAFPSRSSIVKSSAHRPQRDGEADSDSHDQGLERRTPQTTAFVWGAVSADKLKIRNDRDVPPNPNKRHKTIADSDCFRK
jgi:hypothetical protein